jgi:type II pantothenate kinase
VIGEVAYCGLDLGITTTDVVAEWADDVAVSRTTRAFDATADAAVAELLDRTGPPPNGREIVVAATGAGSHRLREQVRGFAVERVSEITAIGHGGIGIAGGGNALVASLGTGTAMVSVRGGVMTHVTPGNGVGGGTLLGLCRALLGTDDLAEVCRLADAGDARRLDITIGEAVGGSLGVLPADGTAANFAKYAAGAAREDVAAALVNLVAEVVLWTILLGMQVAAQSRAVLTGKLALLPPVRRRIDEMSAALGGILIAPPRGSVASALGAMWCVRKRGGA